MTWWHWWHTWEPIAVQQGRFKVAQTAATVVLDRCWCGKTRTRELIGHWTPEEVGIHDRS